MGSCPKNVSKFTSFQTKDGCFVRTRQWIMRMDFWSWLGKISFKKDDRSWVVVPLSVHLLHFLWRVTIDAGLNLHVHVSAPFKSWKVKREGGVCFRSEMGVPKMRYQNEIPKWKGKIALFFERGSSHREVACLAWKIKGLTNVESYRR